MKLISRPFERDGFSDFPSLLILMFADSVAPILTLGFNLLPFKRIGFNLVLLKLLGLILISGSPLNYRF